MHGKSQTDLVLDACASLECVLESQYGAVGKGLHERVTSVENRLDPALVSRIRYLATRRNQVVHERRMLDDPSAYLETARLALASLAGGRAASSTESFTRRAAPRPPSRSIWTRATDGLLSCTWWLAKAVLALIVIGSAIGGWLSLPATYGLGAHLLAALFAAVINGTVAVVVAGILVRTALLWVPLGIVVLIVYWLRNAPL